MWILFHTFFNVIDTNLLQHLHCTLFSICFTYTLVVCFQRLYKLISDCIYRIEASHRILENHSNFFSSEFHHLFWCFRKHILSFESNRSSYYFSRILK